MTDTPTPPVLATPVTLAYAVVSIPRKRRIALLLLLPLAYAACCVAWLLILNNVESVLGTGPTIFALGLSCVIVAATVRAWLPLATGIGHCLICAPFFNLVIILDWGPRAATLPFQVMGAIYLAVSAPMTIWAWFSIRKSDRLSEAVRDVPAAQSVVIIPSQSAGPPAA